MSDAVPRIRRGKRPPRSSYALEARPSRNNRKKQCEHMDGGTLQNRLAQVHLALRAQGVFCRALVSVAVPGNNGMILLTSVRALSKGRPMFGESLVSFFRTELTPSTSCVLVGHSKARSVTKIQKVAVARPRCCAENSKSEEKIWRILRLAVSRSASAESKSCCATRSLSGHRAYASKVSAHGTHKAVPQTRQCHPKGNEKNRSKS